VLLDIIIIVELALSVLLDIIARMASLLMLVVLEVMLQLLGISIVQGWLEGIIGLLRLLVERLLALDSILCLGLNRLQM